MRRFSAIHVLLLLCFALGATVAAHAATPLMVGHDGRPLIWDSTRAIPYKIDPGTLGRLTSAQTQALIARALQVWTDVPDTGLTFTFAGTATDTERSAALQPILAAKGQAIRYDASGDFGRIDLKGVSTAMPTIYFVYDHDGSVLQTLTQSSSIAGLAVNTINGDSTAIVGAVVIINGLLIDGSDIPRPDQSLSDIFAVLIHEIGHTLGLDHTLVNAELDLALLRGDRPISDIRFLPTMFPSYIVGGGDALVTLHPDDIAALQWLYSAAERPLITGVARTADGTPLIGVQAIARAAASPLCQAVGHITGGLCPYFSAAGCSGDTAGSFTLPLPRTDTYALTLEALHPHFGTALTLQRYGHYNVALPSDAQITDLDSSVALSTTSAALNAIDDPDCPLSSGIDVAAVIGATELVDTPLNFSDGLPSMAIVQTLDPNDLLPADESGTTVPVDSDPDTESDPSTAAAPDSTSSGGCALIQ